MMVFRKNLFRCCQQAAYLLAVFLAAPTAAQEFQVTCASCVNAPQLCFNASHLFELNAPFRNQIVITQIGILRSKNTLYFAFEPKISDPEYYKIGYINLDNQNITGIVSGTKNVSNFGTFDIDQENNIVYVGGDDLYYLDSNNKALVFGQGNAANATNAITSIFYKAGVLFVREGENKIVEKVGDEYKTYENYSAVKKFVIDKSNVFVFLNKSGLYADKFKTHDTVHLSKNVFLRGLVVDLDGIIYTWWVDGIYKVFINKNFRKSKLVKIVDLPNIGAMTFDNDNNILYTSAKGLFRLIETPAE